MAKRIAKSDIAEDDLFGQIRSSAEQTIAIIDKLSQSLNKTAEAVKKSVGGAKFDSTKAIDNFVKSTKQANDLQKQAVKLEQERAKATELRSKAMSAQQKRMQEVLKKEQQQKKVTQESLRIEQEKERLAQQRIRTTTAQAQADQKAAAALERERTALKNTAPAYKELSDRSRDLKNKSKDLGAQMLKLEADGKRNSTEWRNLSRQYQAVTSQAKITDQQLKKLDRTVGDNFRNVGNYKSAIGGLKNMLGQLGIAFGFGYIVRDAFNTIKEFDQGMANLASVLGTSRSQIQELEADARRLGETTKFTAGEVAELQTEFAKLGFDDTEILNATESTLNLAGATGTALARAAEVSGATLRGFGLDAAEMGRVNDVMAKSFSTSALDMEKFAESMKYVAPVAKAAGVSLEEATAMLGKLADSGVKGSQAGTSLRRILTDMAMTGKPAKQALQEIADKGITLTDAFDEVGRTAQTSLLILAEHMDGVNELGDTYKMASGVLNESDFLDAAKAAGMSFNKAMAEIRKAEDKGAKATEIFGDELSDLAVKFAETKVNAKTLTKAFDEQRDAAKKMADEQLNTLGGSMALLKSAWEGFILSLNDASGAGNGFASAVRFIAENLKTIMGIVGKALLAWGSYKILMVSLMAIDKARTFSLVNFGKQLAAQIPMTKAYRLEQLKLARAAKTAGTDVANAGRAMSAVPWMAIIAVVIELSMALYDVASGAAEARRQQDLLNASEEAAQRNLSKAADRYRKQFDEKMRKLELEIRTRKSNGEDEKKLEAERLKRSKEITEETIKNIKKEYKVKTDAMAETIKQEEFLRDRIRRMDESTNFLGIGGYSLSEEDIRKQKEYQKFLEKTGLQKRIDDSSDYASVLQLLIARESRLTTEAVGLSEIMAEYDKTLEDVVVTTKENDYEVKKTIHTAKDKKDAVKEVNTELKQQIDLVQELNDVYEELNETETDIDQYLMERKAQGLERQFEDELELQIEYTKKTGEIDKLYLEQLIDARAEMLKTAAREQADINIANLKREHQMRMFELRSQLEEEYRLKLAQEGITPEQKAILKAQYDQQNREINAIEIEYEKVLKNEILRINLEAQGELEDIDIEAANKKKELNKTLLDAQKEYQDGRVKAEEDANKDILEAAKKHMQDMKDIAQLLTDYLVKKSEERIAQMDKEIAAATNQRDYYQELAAQGNITAKESLAEQNRIIAEANLKKEREERRKQKIQLANSVFQTYASKVESGSKSPLAETIRDISLLNQFISAFTPTYEEGTEDTGKQGKGVDGKGGFHAILHPNERVMTKEQNKLVGDLSNVELANLAAEYHAGNVVSKSGATQLGNGWNTAQIIRQLESLEQTIKNKPEHALGVENVVLGAMEIVKSTKVANTTTLNRYKVKK